MAPRVKTNPLPLETPISKENGSPTPFFVRQWQSLLDLVASLIQIQQEIVEINDATIVAGTGLDGGGPISAGTVNLALEDTAVTPGSYTNADITVDQQGRITSAASGSGGGGLDVEDDGVSIVSPATVLNFTGAGVTVTDAGGGQVDIDIPGGGGGGGGGGGWSLVATQALAAPDTFYDFTGLSGNTDLLLLVVQSTRSASSFLRVLASDDNGATFYSGSSNYREIATNGGDATATGYNMGTFASSATRSGFLHLLAADVTGGFKPGITNVGGAHYCTGTTAPITALRLETSAGNFTGGTAYLFERPAGGGGGGGGVTMYPLTKPTAALFGSIVQSTNAAAAGTASIYDSTIRDAVTFNQIGLTTGEGGARVPLLEYSSAHTTWEWTVGFMGHFGASNFAGVGLYAGDSANRVMALVFQASTFSMTFAQYTNSGDTFDATFGGLTQDDNTSVDYYSGIVFIKLKFASGILKYQFSLDGEHFSTVGSLNMASSEFASNIVNQIGLYLLLNDSGRNTAVEARANDSVAIHAFSSVYSHT